MPLLPPGLFRRAPFTLAHVLNALVGMALITAMVNIPLLVASVLNGGAAEGGLLLLRLTLLIPVGAVPGGAAGRAARLPLGRRRRHALHRGGLLADERLAHAIHATALACYDPAPGPGRASASAWSSRRSRHHAGLGGRRAGRAGLGPGQYGAHGRHDGRPLGAERLGLELFKSLMANHPAPLPGLGETEAAYNARLADYSTILADASLQVYTLGFLAARLVALLAVLPALGLRRPAQPLAGA